MSIVANLLAKAEQFHRQAVAAQPVDPLAGLTDDQRRYYSSWWEKFKAENSANAEALYMAQLNCSKWTPNDWLNYPRITTEMTIEQAADIWKEQL